MGAQQSSAVWANLDAMLCIFKLLSPRSQAMVRAVCEEWKVRAEELLKQLLQGTPSCAVVYNYPIALLDERHSFLQLVLGTWYLLPHQPSVRQSNVTFIKMAVQGAEHTHLLAFSEQDRSATSPIEQWLWLGHPSLAMSGETAAWTRLPVLSDSVVNRGSWPTDLLVNLAAQSFLLVKHHNEYPRHVGWSTRVFHSTTQGWVHGAVGSALAAQDLDCHWDTVQRCAGPQGLSIYYLQMCVERPEGKLLLRVLKFNAVTLVLDICIPSSPVRNRQGQRINWATVLGLFVDDSANLSLFAAFSYQDHEHPPVDEFWFLDYVLENAAPAAGTWVPVIRLPARDYLSDAQRSNFCRPGALATDAWRLHLYLCYEPPRPARPEFFIVDNVRRLILRPVCPGRMIPQLEEDDDRISFRSFRMADGPFNVDFCDSHGTILPPTPQVYNLTLQMLGHLRIGQSPI